MNGEHSKVESVSTETDLKRRVKQLEHGYDELRTICNRQQSQLQRLEQENAELRIELAHYEEDATEYMRSLS